ncbi:MAG: hypothetical protein RLZZ500_1238 [Bacteroidota bacterium]|jgi:tetratricopeptide (TPR) repeat protein
MKTTTLRTLFLGLLLYFVSSQTLQAQYAIDSLKKIIANPKLHDTTRLANIALIIDNLYEDKESERYNALMGKIAQKHLNEGGISRELEKKYTMYLAAYFNNISFQLENKGDKRALPYLQKSLDLYHSVEAYDEYYSSLVSKGLLLYRQKKEREAIQCYFEALKFFEKKPKENADGISYVYSNLGALYGEQDLFKESIKCLKKAIYYLDHKGTTPTLEDALQKAGMYYNLGAAYFARKEFRLATHSYLQALKYAEATDQRSYQCYVLCKLSDIDLYFKRLEDAEAKLMKAKILAENELSSCGVWVALGELYFTQKKYPKAITHLEEGLRQATAIHNRNLEMEAYHLLYKSYKATGDTANALTMAERFHQINDSLKIFENRKELKVQNLKYNYEKRDLQHQLEAQQKNYIVYGLSALFILLASLAFFLFKNYRQKHAIVQLEKNELRQKLLRSQMNPHFIFNSIDNIQSLIYNQKSAEAVNYLTKFSKLTRQILENSNENLIPLAEEITMIENYLVIQQLLYNNKFNYTLEVSENLNLEAILIPPMLTQPFIENAIKHGLKDKISGGLIHVRFYQNENKIYFEVSDNGNGFSPQDTSNRKSLALKIAKERLVFASGNTQFNVSIENRTDTDNNILGAKVSFEIPYLYEN